MITNYSFSNTIRCNNQMNYCSTHISMHYAANIENIKYNEMTWIPQTQFILCKYCCSEKQDERFASKTSKCKVFHDGDFFDCPNGCDSIICNKCDIKKQCAANGCSIHYYKCCRRNKFVEQCQYPECQYQYCKACVLQSFVINDCSCGKHTDICHKCDHSCYKFFKCNSILRRI
eukprot:252556_1